MTDKQPMQASGEGHPKAQADGIGDMPAKDAGGGESGGGAYPDPQTGRPGDNGGFMGHGGQTHNDYSGSGAKGDPGAGNANAVAGGE